ncbi:MAG: DUF2012 domain-containing protein [Candidatus Marinimicrobia bacterium]|nr:DUF2012 domain-containing protein [Candidatus Neomarinimicrobiota bacterium]
MSRFLSSIFILQFTLPLLLFAQSVEKITGVVTDASSGEPVEMAAVSLNSNETGTYTDRDGRFTFQNIPLGNYTLRVSHIAFQPAEKRINVSKIGNTRIQISLNPEKFWSDSILVEAEKYHTGDIHLDRTDIMESQAHSIAELLQRVPQISVITASGSGNAGVSIHGSNSNQVLVLLDGIPLNDPLTGKVDLREVPTGQIESVDISTTGSSAEYGQGAFAGVVSLHSVNQTLSGAETELSAGSFGYRSIATGLNGTVGDWTYSLNANRRLTKNEYSYRYDLPDGSTVNTRRRNADLESTGVNAGIKQMSSASLLQVRGFFFHSDRGMPGRVFQWTPYAAAQTDRFGMSGQYQWAKQKSTLDISARYGGSANEYVNQPPDNAPLQYRQVPAFKSEYLHNSVQSQVKYRRIFSDNISTHIDLQGRSGQFQQAEKENEYSAAIQAKQNNIGLGTGVDIQIPLADDHVLFLVSPAIRQDFIKLVNQDDTSTYPFLSYSFRGEIKFRQLLNSSVYTVLERSFRPPTYGDLFYQDFRVNGNPGLQPEKSRGYYLGVQASIQQAVELNLSSEVFWKDVTDQIIWLTGSFGNFSPANTDSYITGQTLSADWSIRDNLLFGSVYFEHLLPLDKTNEHTVHNRMLPFRPEFQWQASAGMAYRQFRLEYFHRYQGIRYSTRSNTKYLKPFDVADLNLRIELPLDQILRKLQAQFGFSIENIWNAEYEIMHRMPEPGRHWRSTLTIQLTP